MLNLLILSIAILQFVKIYHHLAGNFSNPKLVQRLYLLNILAFFGYAIVHAALFMTNPALTFLASFVIIDAATVMTNAQAFYEISTSMKKVPVKRKKIGFE